MRYPITIITTRYGGVYEGGGWAAFNCHPEEVPLAATGDDTDCADWWYRHSSEVGVGWTPDAALLNLPTKGTE